jgi:drug/metabolite transporter (DMT)-like permease
MTILLGSLAAILFGIGDFVAGVGGRSVGRSEGAAGIALTASGAGAALSGLYLLLWSDDVFVGDDIWWALAAAVFMSTARPLLYRGMTIGPIVVFAPIFGLVALVVPAGLGLAAGQALDGLQVAGVLTAVPAIVLLSGEGRLPALGDLRASPTLARAAVVGALVGLAGLSLSFISDDAGTAPAFVVTLVGLGVIPLIGRAAGMPLRVTPATAGFGAVVGLTSIVAVMLTSITYQRSNAAIGSALIGLSPGISILLAWRLLNERMRAIQLLGCSLGSLTVTLLALAERAA